MQKRFFLLVFVFAGFISSNYSWGNWVEINQSNPVSADVQLLYSNIDESGIQFSLDGFWQRALQTPKGREFQIAVEGGVQIFEKGMPDLGKLAVNIIIPDLDDMEIHVVRSEYRVFENIPVGPSKGHFTRDIRPGDVPFVYGDAYELDEYWPGKLAQLEEPFIMRDFRGQTVTIFPFQYNPVKQTLKVYTLIEVAVVSTGDKGTDPFYRTREEIVLEPEFNQVYQRFFLNMDATKSRYPMLEGEEGSMLIIAYDSFMEAMQPFIDWKRTIGRRTEMVPSSAAGTTATEIKNYVVNYYNNNPDFAHLLLVGDGPQIPPMIYNNNHSDNAYGFIVGSNAFNDIFVGRFSAETVAHVETQVQRMIEYERDLNETDTWLNVAQGVARNEGAGGGHFGEADHVHMNFIRDTLLNFTYTHVHQRYDGPGFSTSAALISQDINNGVSVINYCNHGSVTGWSVASYNASHVNALTNVGRLPYVTAVACVNGNFVNNLCFAETWLRATHNGEPTGAVGMMASTINQLWQPPMCGQDEMVSIKTEASIPHGPTIKRTYGGVSINGSMYMIPQYGTGGINTHATWILFGDPSLMIRTDVPTAFNPSYTPTIFIGADQLQVTVPGAEGAVVAISRYNEVNQEVEIVGTATVSGGTATIDFAEPLSEPGEVTLAITGFNRVTYINDEIQVIPPDGPYVVMKGFTIDDSAGNNNSQADYGELIHLDVVLENVGIEVAEGVQAEITGAKDYVTVINSQAFWGDINEGQSVTVNTAFTLEVDELIPNNHLVLFTLIITDAENNVWESNLSLRIYSPQFAISNLWIDDAEHGDGDGVLDPGETADVMVTFTNQGGAPAMAPVSIFMANSPYLTIVTGEIGHAVIPAGGSVDAAYTVEAHAAAMEGLLVDVEFGIEDGHMFESEQQLVIGQLPEMTIGEGSVQSNQYPFYNYYRANRSQMIYLQSELGAGQKTIQEIAFEIIHASASHNELPNFEIRMVHTTAATLSAFQATTAGDVVYSANPHVMPLSTGWHHWELDSPFDYDGIHNLLVEVVWGRLPNWTSDYYRVASTNVGANRVAYGFSDWVDIPDYSGNSAVRPNIWMGFASAETGEEKRLDFEVTDSMDNPLENAGITIGSLTRFSNVHGQVSFDLMSGNYHFKAEKESYIPVEDMVNLDDNMELTVVLVQDAIMPGDANGDGVVNILDVVTIVEFFAGNNPDPFYFQNADVNQDGIIDLLDVIATLNLFTQGKATPYQGMESDAADMYLHHDGISLQSDGTLAGLQFEISSGTGILDMQVGIPGYQLVYVQVGETMRAMVFSLGNTPIPAGNIRLISFDYLQDIPVWIDAFAGNLNADRVAVNTHTDVSTGVDISGDNLAFRAFPNPASDILHVEFINRSNGPVSVSLINAHGRILQTQQANRQGAVSISFDLQGLPAGLYMLRVDYRDDYFTEKIMVQ